MIKKIKLYLDTHNYPKTDKSYLFLINAFNKGVQNSLLGVRASAIAFKLIMAAIPLLIVILNLLPSFFTHENLNNFTLLMQEYLPKNVYTVIDGPINYILFDTTRGYTGVWIFVALFIALNGVRLIIESFNASYHIKETRPIWEQFITSFIIWILITILLVISIVLFLINKDIFNWLVSLDLMNQNVIHSFYFIAKYVLFFILLVLLFEIIFYIAPARRRKFRFMTSGTIIAAISTLIITGGFDIFISNFSNYNKIYGPLATVFIFFLWLQTVAFMILVGFEINAVVYLADEENPRHIISKINFKKIFSKHTKKLKNNELQEKKINELNRLSIDEYKKKTKLPLILILDDIRSKYNVGSIFRTADGFNVDKIYLCGITPCPPDREIEKTALGATESVNWEYETNIIDLIKKLKNLGYYLIGLEQTFNSTSALDLPKDIPSPMAIVLGHEIKGINDDVLAMVDMAVEIPQWGTKHSLNVSVAAAIIMWEIVKRNFIK